MKQRERIRRKTDGHCWYCGVKLGKRWHIDHVIPRHTYGSTNDDENLVPACAPCNLFKGPFSLADFRKEIAAQVERGRKSSVNFRTAERFGLIEATEKPVVFWFEQSGVEHSIGQCRSVWSSHRCKHTTIGSDLCYMCQRAAQTTPTQPQEGES